MRVLARIVPALRHRADCIIVRPMFQREAPESHAGTLLLTKVKVKKNVMGEVLELNERRVSPRQEIRNWPTMRYVGSLGGYFDTRTGTMVESAKAVYMVGDRIYYLPEAS